MEQHTDSHIWMQDFTGSIYPPCFHQDHAVKMSLWPFDLQQAVPNSELRIQGWKFKCIDGYLKVPVVEF